MRKTNIFTNFAELREIYLLINAGAAKATSSALGQAPAVEMQPRVLQSLRFDGFVTVRALKPNLCRAEPSFFAGASPQCSPSRAGSSCLELCVALAQEITARKLEFSR